MDAIAKSRIGTPVRIFSANARFMNCSSARLRVAYAVR